MTQTSNTQTPEIKKLQQFCKIYIKKIGHPLIIPFFEKETKPRGYLKKLKEIQELYDYLEFDGQTSNTNSSPTASPPNANILRELTRQITK